jgi:site-specific recombinase XerD
MRNYARKLPANCRKPAFAGQRGPAELRTVTRAHVIAWRKDLEKRELAPSSIRRKLSALAGHGQDLPGPVFRPVTNNRTGELDRPLDPASVYQNIVRKYGLETGISAQVNGLCVHSLRATAATNALSHEADIAKVQEWLGHANVSTTRL